MPSELEDIRQKYEAEKAKRKMLEQQLRLVLRTRQSRDGFRAPMCEDAAATRLQASWRGTSTRLANTRANSAATQIQSTFRGKMVRKRGLPGKSRRTRHGRKQARSTGHKTAGPKNAAQAQATALVLGGAAAAAAAAAGASRSAVAVAAGSAAANTLIALGGSRVAAEEVAVKAANNAGGSSADVAHIAGLAAGNAAIAARVSPSIAGSTASAACHAQQSSAALPAVIAGAIAGKAATLRGVNPKKAGHIGGLAARAAGGSEKEVTEVTWLATVAAAQWRAAGDTGLTAGTATVQQQQQQQQQQIQQQLHRQGGGLETKLQALEAELAASGGRGTTTGDGRRLARQIKILKRRLQDHTRSTTAHLVGPSTAYESLMNPPAVAPSKEVAAIFAAALVFAPVPAGTTTADALSTPRNQSTASRRQTPAFSSGKVKTRPMRPGRKLVSNSTAGSVHGTSGTRHPTRPRSAPITRGGRGRTAAQSVSGTSAHRIPRTPHTPRTPRTTNYGATVSAKGNYFNPLKARGPAGVGGTIVRAPVPAVLTGAHGMVRQDDGRKSGTRAGQTKGKSCRRSRLANSGTDGSVSALLWSDAWGRG